MENIKELKGPAAFPTSNFPNAHETSPVFNYPCLQEGNI